MPETPIQLAEQLQQELQEYIRQNIVGMASNEDTLRKAELLARERYAERLGVPVDFVTLLNLRYDDEGRTVSWDGIALGVTNEMAVELERLRLLDAKWSDASEFGDTTDMRNTRDDFAFAASAFVRKWSRQLQIKEPWASMPEL